MSTTRNCAVMFADLRGSTALYLRLGNTEAATVVTHSLAMLGQIIARAGGRVVKTLGDGLMAVFFLVAGLEIKRELVVGELSTKQKAMLPLVAAVGGMVVPAAIYLVVNVNPG